MRLMFARALTVALAVLGGAAAMAFPKLIVAEAVPDAVPSLIAARTPDAMTVIHVASRRTCPGAPGSASPRGDEAAARRADADSERGRLVDAAARSVCPDDSRSDAAEDRAASADSSRTRSAADPRHARAGSLAGTGPHPCSRSAGPLPCRGAGRDPGTGEGSRRGRRRGRGRAQEGQAAEAGQDVPAERAGRQRAAQLHSASGSRRAPSSLLRPTTSRVMQTTRAGAGSAAARRARAPSHSRGYAAACANMPPCLASAPPVRSASPTALSTSGAGCRPRSAAR